MNAATVMPIAAFSPELRAGDEVGAFWLRQVALRLRREIAWRWHECGEGSRAPSSVSDRLIESLDMVRHWEAKQRFFAEDTAALFLSERLAEPLAPSQADPPRGSFGWVVEELGLDEVSTFGLALALITTFDSAAAPVVAACLNDAGRTQPTLELAQRLWDRPEDVLSLSDPSHPLWRIGLLQQPALPGPFLLGWDVPLVVSPPIAARLLFPEEPASAVLKELASATEASLDPSELQLTRARLQADRTGLRVVPVQGLHGSAYHAAMTAVARATGLGSRVPDVEPGQLEDPGFVRSLLVLAWLLGDALCFPLERLPIGGERGRVYAAFSAARGAPVTILLAIKDRSDLNGLPDDLLLPVVSLQPLTYERRAELWRESLDHRRAALDSAISECARRFRYESETISTLCDGLNRLHRPATPAELLAACRAEVQIDCGDLAQRVEPRFEPDELVLPPDRARQLEEIHRAMVSLTEVHYDWGTARPWNEGGISVLFAGPPGTGKTMAAEVLARRLAMPMYRIDLSQVVDKYIGVTEKNLKRLFDAADVSDVVLFFDEADALFGRRTEVRDAHDRYANLEISYLLERMERFKGLAILATNRRKDLDEAFLRRLRFIVEFPLPDVAEREEIWRRVLPSGVDASSLDLPFLARQFPLAGGHIRSVVFNACLQSAGGDGRRALTMEAVVVAVKREYDKLKRSVSLDQFGRYAPLVEQIAP
jgi:hypothetical protein